MAGAPRVSGTAWQERNAGQTRRTIHDGSSNMTKGRKPQQGPKNVGPVRKGKVSDLTPSTVPASRVGKVSKAPPKGVGSPKMKAVAKTYRTGGVRGL